MRIRRPMPPARLADAGCEEELFAAAPELMHWARSTMLAPESRLYNADHAHLGEAAVGFVWTNVAMSRHMRSVAGQAEMPRVQGNRWLRSRCTMHLRLMLGFEPVFLITIYAPYAAEAGGAEFCALIDHELYHCGQARDAFGEPAFKRDGSPMYGIRGHDAEEFVGVVRRWGVGAAAGGVDELVAAAARKPAIAAADLRAVCGTCLRAAA